MRALLIALSSALLVTSAQAAELSAPEALARASAGQVTIIDVRTPGEWQQTGIAPGARTADFMGSTFIADVLKITGGDKAAPLALVCRSGQRSAKAVELLTQNGFTNLNNVAGGMNDWTSRKLPTVQP